jgi:hypothetical protein
MAKQRAAPPQTYMVRRRMREVKDGGENKIDVDRIVEHQDSSDVSFRPMSATETARFSWTKAASVEAA